MSNEHTESLEELLRRATATDTDNHTDNESSTFVEDNYVLPENPYERQMLNEETNSNTSAENSRQQTKGKRKKKEKKVAEQDIPYSDEEEDEKKELRNTLQEILSGTFLGGKWLRRNIIYSIFVTLLILIYVNNGYRVSDARIEQQRLQDTLEDRRLRELTLSSELTFKTRISSVEQVLKDTALTLPKDNIYTLPVKETSE